jgi:hypothetical protein
MQRFATMRGSIVALNFVNGFESFTFRRVYNSAGAKTSVAACRVLWEILSRSTYDLALSMQRL